MRVTPFAMIFICIFGTSQRLAADTAAAPGVAAQGAGETSPLPFSIWKNNEPGLTPPKHHFVRGESNHFSGDLLRQLPCAPSVVVLEFTVQIDGRVTDMGLLQSSGDKRYDEAFEKDVSAWLYTPARKDGIPVAAKLQTQLSMAKTGGPGSCSTGPLAPNVSPDFSNTAH